MSEFTESSLLEAERAVSETEDEEAAKLDAVLRALGEPTPSNPAEEDPDVQAVLDVMHAVRRSGGVEDDESGINTENMDEDELVVAMQQAAMARKNSS